MTPTRGSDEEQGRANAETSKLGDVTEAIRNISPVKRGHRAAVFPGLRHGCGLRMALVKEQGAVSTWSCTWQCYSILYL